MTFTKAILKRRPFQCRVMGMPFSVVFDEAWCDMADAAGMSRFTDGAIALNPALDDNRLLDTAAHELAEHANERFEWNKDHKTIQQEGMFWGSLLECDCLPDK